MLTMFGNLSRFKPAVKMQTLLLLSALLWTAIGCMLFLRGILLCLGLGPGSVFLGISAVFVGCLKSLFILDKAATRGVERILKFQDGTCLGAVYSVTTWILVLCMMGLGVMIRNSSIPADFVAFIYLAIGWGLFFSSRHAWGAWFHKRF